MKAAQQLAAIERHRRSGIARVELLLELHDVAPEVLAVHAQFLFATSDHRVGTNHFTQ